MTPLLELAQHRVPEDAEVLEIKVCENCAFPFTRDRSSLARYGPNCRAALNTDNQVWVCGCGTFRAWGIGRPLETADVQLLCIRCNAVTRHQFWKVA